MVDWIIGIGAAAIVIWTIVHHIKASKSDKSGCSSCSGCGSKDNCHEK